MTTVLDKFASFYTDLASMQVSELSRIYSDNVTFVDPIKSHEGLEAVEDYFSSLLHNAKHCRFVIHELTPNSAETNPTTCTITWTMEFKSNKLNSGNLISVDGITTLRLENDKITYHRDYYDLGQMVYEHVPLLGRVIKKIKRSVA